MSVLPTDIEKKSLKAHVEICAVRYGILEEKLDNLEIRMDKVEGHLVEIKDSLGKVGGESNKTLITVGTSVFGVILAGLITVIVHLASK
mgnify:FL=1